MEDDGYTTTCLRPRSADRIKYFSNVWLLFFDQVHYISAHNTYDAEISRFNQYTYQINRSTEINAVGCKVSGIKSFHPGEFYH